jgi:ABC-type amino acid transport system permease subunit
MIRLPRFLATLIACIGVAFALSLLAVHAFWIGVKISHSVPFARASDAAGSFALLPAHGALRLLDLIFDTSTIVPEPRLVAGINAVIVGLCFCAWLRRHR